MKKIIILLLLIALFICGCDAGYNRYSAGATDYYAATHVINKHVPCPPYLDLRLDSVNLLETDEYGRELFCYEIMESRINIFLILQKTEEMFTYYYEDDCYAFTHFDADISEQEMNDLKERNDWGKPINQEKMVRMSYAKQHAGKSEFLDYFAVRDAVMDRLQKTQMCENICQLYINGMDKYSSNMQLLLADVRHEDHSKHYFLVLYDHDLEQPVIEIEELQGIDSFREEIIAFKEQHGLISEKTIPAALS